MTTESARPATHAYLAHFACGCIFGMTVDDSDNPKWTRDRLRSVLKQPGAYIERVTIRAARRCRWGAICPKCKDIGKRKRKAQGAQP